MPYGMSTAISSEGQLYIQGTEFRNSNFCRKEAQYYLYYDGLHSLRNVGSFCKEDSSNSLEIMVPGCTAGCRRAQHVFRPFGFAVSSTVQTIRLSFLL